VSVTKSMPARFAIRYDSSGSVYDSRTSPSSPSPKRENGGADPPSLFHPSYQSSCNLPPRNFIQGQTRSCGLVPHGSVRVMDAEDRGYVRRIQGCLATSRANGKRVSQEIWSTPLPKIAPFPAAWVKGGSNAGQKLVKDRDAAVYQRSADSLG
jgi:hypothetical protein